MDVKETLDANGKPYFEVKSSKYKNPFIVRKTNDGFAFFEVAVKGGKLPASLEGRHTTSTSAVQAIKAYINQMPETKTVRRDNYSKEREEKNASKVAAEG